MCDAKAYLKRIRWLDVQIDGLLQDLEKEKARATKVTATISPVAVAHSGSNGNIEDPVLKIIALQDEINQKIDRFVDLKREIETIVERIEDANQVAVIRKRYMEYKPWELIAVEMGCKYRNVCYIHSDALKTVEALLKGGVDIGKQSIARI